MHCELVVPGLLAAAQGIRLPAAELILAKGRRTHSEPRSVERWLQDAFELEGAAFPAGALTILARGAAAPGEFWVRADPVHVQLMRDHLVAGAVSVSNEEAEALRDALNRHFAGRLELYVAAPLRWCARLAEPLELREDSPLGRSGGELRPGTPGEGLLNEIQMLLHAHPVNEAREARGELPINSLWLWGAGPAPASAASSWQSVTADDPVALGLARAAKSHGRTLPVSASAWLERLPEDGRHLLLLDAAAVAALEQAWFAPLLAALRSGRVGMLTVHVPDSRSGVSFETIRGDLRRFWRRPRPVATDEA